MDRLTQLREYMEKAGECTLYQRIYGGRLIPFYHKGESVFYH